MRERNRRRIIRRLIGKLQLKGNRKIYPCMFPGCNSNAIDSHSQQKEGQLRAISQDGKVAAIQRNPYQALKHEESTGESDQQIIQVGIREAAVFKGFCAAHDSELFSEIENTPIALQNERHLLLLHLRALSFELAQRRKALEFIKGYLHEARELIHEDAVKEAEHIIYWYDRYITQDSPHFLKATWAAIDANDYSKFQFATLRKEMNLNISCCSCFDPSLEKEDDSYSVGEGEPLPQASVNIVPSSTDTIIVCAWLSEFSSQARWIQSSLNEKTEETINRLAFCESEDTTLSPSLWAATDSATQQEVLVSMIPHNFRGPTLKIPIVVRL